MKIFAVVLALLAASAALAACGSSSSSSGSESTSAPPAGGAKEAEGGTVGTASSVEFEPDPNGALEFTSKRETAKAGKVTIDFTNSSGIPHDVVIEDSSGKTVAQVPKTGEGSESTVANLKPGTYTYFCSVPGHREAGMEGTLTVK